MKNNEKVFSYKRVNNNDYSAGYTWLMHLQKGDKIRIYIDSSHSSNHIRCEVDSPNIFNGKYLGPM